MATQGISECSAGVAVAIRDELVGLRRSERSDQKAIRSDLRDAFGFYISDFTKSTSGFTANDLDELVASGQLAITAISTEAKRAYAMSIVVESELAAGLKPEVVPSVAQERIHGCDVLSYRPEKGDPDRVEVKGWGPGFLSKKGKFTYDQDIRASQLAAAKSDPNFRVEIVANLDNFLRGQGRYERLTLTPAEILDESRLHPQIYWISLDGLQDRIRRLGG